MTGGVIEMKEKNSKGFYIALYSCVGVLLIGSAVIAYTMVSNTNNAVVPVSTLGVNDFTPSSPVGQIAPSANNMQDAGIRDFFNNAPPEATPAPTQAATTTAAPPQVVPQQQQVAPTIEEQEPEVTPVFREFTEATSMVWPVVGEIVMNYRTDGFVFDPTLNHYRTNDTMKISAVQGTAVRASAEGIVSNVFYTRETGNVVEIDHGNGWATTYSQLQDNVLVAEGDVVLAGAVIGQVSSPSPAVSGLGDNMGFRVTSDGVSVNPLSLLE